MLSIYCHCSPECIVCTYSASATELRGAYCSGTLATKSPEVRHGKAAQGRDDRPANPKRIAIGVEKNKQASIPDFLEGELQTSYSHLHAKAGSLNPAE